MNRLGQLADDLTELIEELERAPYADDARSLCKALQRAFVKACELDRLIRKRGEAAAEALSSAAPAKAA